MARGPESTFTRRVRRAWSGHFVRVEASLGGVDPGTPDTVMSIAGRGGWIEMKVWPEPVSEIQLVWHEEALRDGAYAMVLCEVKKRRVWLGRAADYARLSRPPEGISLQAALRLIECALCRSAVR